MTSTDTVTAPEQLDAGWLKEPEITAVFDGLSREGDKVWAVGGAVRNSLLGIPVTDIDLATTAHPETVMELARRAGFVAIPTGIQHGTVTVVADGRPFEVTTLRHDIETFGRHAKVGFTDDLCQDAMRRDFTINAFYLSSDGRLFDPLDSFQDLKDGRIRFIGNARMRIEEDYLRILRFFRFNAQFGRSPLDKDGLTACVQEYRGLSILSKERIGAEFLKLLAAPNARVALHAMFDHGLLVAMLGMPPNIDCFDRLVMIQARLKVSPDPIIRLAALALRVEEDSDQLSNRFRLSKPETQLLRRLACELSEISACLGPDEAKVILYRLKENLYRSMVLYNWAVSGDDASDENWACDENWASDENWNMLFALPSNWEVPEFPLSGRDMLSLGVESGPRVGELLQQAEQWWIESGFKASREQLLFRLKNLVI